MILSSYTREGKKRTQASKLFADFWIWDNFLRSGRHTLDTLPMQSIYFHVEKLQAEDALYMCVFTRSQVIQNAAISRIRFLFRQANRPEPLFVTMLKFRKMQSEILPGVMG